MIDIQDAPEKTKRIFDQIQKEFDAQNINPTPLNYYVWYVYLKGSHPDLTKEMNAILNDPFGYNDRVGRRLYDDYLGDEETVTSEFDRAFRRLIDAMVKKMNVWTEKLEKHTNDLNECAQNLQDPDLGADEIKNITKCVIDTAHSMHEGSKAFQEEMINTSDEIRQLRQELIEARAESMTDELTEIGNRKAFNHTLQELTFEADIKLETEDETGLYLIMTDIDHFKKFNDTFGHLVGDSVLRYFANTIRKHKLDNETVCRYGGEEFGILLSDSNLEEVAERAEQIRNDIELANLKSKTANKPLGTITASFGIAQYRGKIESVDDFVTRADKALYKAKENGRNQVVTEHELEAEEE